MFFYETIITLTAIVLPLLFVFYLVHRSFRLRERRLEIEAGMAAEKAAQYASRSMELEQRVRVLEQIVTDAGAQTANQIEALRDKPRIPTGDQAQ